MRIGRISINSPQLSAESLYKMVLYIMDIISRITVAACSLVVFGFLVGSIQMSI